MWRGVFALPFFSCFLTGQSFSGLVLEDHSGKPVRGARVQVKVSGAARLTADLESGADGTFRAEVALPPGDYRVSVTKPNYDDTPLRLTVPLAGPLSVRLVRFGSISGRVTDTRNGPMRGVNIFALAEEAGGIFRPLAMSAQTDDTGAYRLFSLTPGRYAVGVSWASMNPGSLGAGAYLFPNNQKPQVFPITSGSVVTGIDFVKPAQSEYTVSGRLVFPDTGKFGGVTLSPREQPSLAAVMVRTEPTGKFRLEGIAPGSYELMAAAPANGYAGFGIVLDVEPVFARMPLDVAGQPIADLTITPETGRTVSFTLKSDAGCPHAATVQLTPMENWGALVAKTVEATTAAPATVKHLAPGRFRVAVSKPSEQCFAREQVLDLRTTESVTVELLRGGNVEGRVEPAEARPTITLTALDGPDAGRQQSLPDGEGRFRFPDVRPGQYRVQAGTATANVTVLSKASATVTLRIKEER